MKTVDHTLLMRNNQLDRVSSYNYLGVHLDMNLSFHKYLQGCVQRANPKFICYPNYADILITIRL